MCTATCACMADGRLFKLGGYLPNLHPSPFCLVSSVTTRCESRHDVIPAKLTPGRVMSFCFANLVGVGMPSIRMTVIYMDVKCGDRCSTWIISQWSWHLNQLASVTNPSSQINPAIVL